MCDFVNMNLHLVYMPVTADAGHGKWSGTDQLHALTCRAESKKQCVDTGHLATVNAWCQFVLVWGASVLLVLLSC